MGEGDTSRGRPTTGPKPDPTTQDQVRRATEQQLIGAIPRLQQDLFDAEAELSQPGLSENDQADAATRYGAIQDAYYFAAQELVERGLDLNGDPLPDDGGQSQAIASGNLNARYAELEQRRQEQLDRREEVRLTLENQQKDRSERQRGTNIDATLDLLESQVRKGELTSSQARDRAAAAFDQASIERDILRDQAPFAVAPGAKHFPNLGPGGPIDAALKALLPDAGAAFTGFETTGTIPIDPAGIAAPIGQAFNQGNPDGAAQIGTAIEAAQKLLAGQGVQV